MAEPLHLVLNPVRADRADAFESFLADVVTPAMRAERPDLDGRWRVLRSVEPSDGVLTYAFLFDGGTLEEDWELDKLLPAHLGQEEADRLVADALEAFAPVGAWAEAAAAAGAESNQVVWTMEPVSLG